MKKQILTGLALAMVCGMAVSDEVGRYGVSFIRAAGDVELPRAGGEVRGAPWHDIRDRMRADPQRSLWTVTVELECPDCL